VGRIKTLALMNGDIMPAQGGYLLYSGVNRIRQDLSLALMEEYGTDRFHPKWGSVIRQYIGNVITPQLQAMVQAEVNRVVQNYILIQQAEVLRDSNYDVRGRWSTSDVVRSVLAIKATTSTDRIDVRLALETLSRTKVTISRQVVM
jgi:phage baseplate assembly protein W